MMKKIIAFAVLAVVWPLAASAQIVNNGQNSSEDIISSIVERLNRNSSPNRVNKLAVLGDELMWLTSFDDVAKRLMRERFTVEIEVDGTLKASSKGCELTAVNRQKLLEQIDTLTLFIKHPLKKEVVTDSLESIGYVFKNTSADGRFDWWKHKVSNINLAVYYQYSNKYPSAMLFARPKQKPQDVIEERREEEVPPAEVEEVTEDIPEAAW